MGKLIDGKWHVQDVRGKSDSGAFEREDTTILNKVGPGTEFPIETDRYHLYVSYACPWAHRTLLTREFKGLQKHISVSVVSPFMLDQGWSFKHDFDDIAKDDIFGKEYLKDVYTECLPNYTGKVTVPILFDKKQNKMVNNESSQIIRMLNNDFNELAENKLDLFPTDLQAEIEKWNKKTYESINNGVYKCGFAKNQEAYDKAFKELFSSLELVDKRLQQVPYLCGDILTEADIRLIPTLIRFDHVYHTHFKCNGKLIAQYQGLSNYLNRFLEMQQVKATTHIDHIKAHYYYSHESINPTRIIPLGPL